MDYSSFFYSIAGCSATIIAIIGGFIASKLISISADRDNILDKIKEINDELNMKTKQHDDIIEKLDDDDALDFLSDMANGDARSALTAIELGVLTTEPSADGKIHITLSVASECIQRRVVKYDKSGDNHYDTISAFIKSMRGSDPDAAIYYLARMLYAGEDVKFIARRIMICAAEDVGNADPQALQVAVAAAQAVERIGMPESQIILAEATNYVACAPKSNASYLSIDAAMHMVASGQTPPIPVHLQDSHYKSAGKLGHGIGYQYAHDFKNHYVAQQYLPDALAGARFYEPTDMGYEKQIRDHLEKIRREAE